MGSAQSSCTGGDEGGKSSRLHALVHDKAFRKLLLVVPIQSRWRRKKEMVAVGEKNDSWLLSESATASAGDDPHTVHSSFRFSFGARVELEPFGMGLPQAAEATVLMVNLEKNLSEGDSVRIRQVELLLRSVSSVDPSLIRFSYAQISSATNNFSQDKKGAGKALLSWSARYKVALGIADAIAYLHNGTDKCVVHRDIKPSNILLTSKRKPKLCDFGLATWTPAPSVPFLCKTVKGTFGYLAPEYFQHGKVSDKTDVYAFGVVLLELLTGRKPIETARGSGEENLVLWAKPLIRKGAAGELIDPRLNNKHCDQIQVSQLAEAAHACLTSEEGGRPRIDQVVSILRGREHGTAGDLSYITRNGSINCYFQTCDLQANNEMKSHVALAMLGVSDFEEADLYCR